MMRKALGTALGSSVAASTALCALWATGCVQPYKAPALPNNQLALVTLDSSASVLDVDGLPPPSGNKGQKLKEFFVGAGCRKLTAKYEESYFIWGGKKAEKAGLGTGLAVSLANTEQHDYETMKPIRFFIPTKAVSSRSNRAATLSTSSCPTSPAKPAHSRSDRAAFGVELSKQDQPAKTGKPLP
jgi:hypothetical protein